MVGDALVVRGVPPIRIEPVTLPEGSTAKYLVVRYQGELLSLELKVKPRKKGRKEGGNALERKLKSIGIVNWDKRQTTKVISKAIKMIARQLGNPHVGLGRREHLLKLRTELQDHARLRSTTSVVSGGLPSLGKRR
jgi:hypothetical protein